MHFTPIFLLSSYGHRLLATMGVPTLVRMTQQCVTRPTRLVYLLDVRIIGQCLPQVTTLCHLRYSLLSTLSFMMIVVHLKSILIDSGGKVARM